MPEFLEFRWMGEAFGNACSVLRANASSAGLTAPVPTCPGWTVLDLVLHTGMVHRWTSAQLSGKEPRSDADVQLEGKAAPDVLEWFDDGMVELLNVIAKAPADLDVKFFLRGGPPAPRDAWLRRMMHETTIHAVDAMAARLGRAPAASEIWFSPELAADGLDELLVGVFGRPRYAWPTEHPQRTLIAPTDVERTWLLELSPDGTKRATRNPDQQDADVTVTGPARQLYLTLWNRGTEASITGDDTWLDAWRHHIAVEW